MMTVRKSSRFLRHARALKNLRDGRPVKFVSHGSNTCLVLNVIEKCPIICRFRNLCSGYQALTYHTVYCIDYFGETND
jgi:hypothetical protein